MSETKKDFLLRGGESYLVVTRSQGGLEGTYSGKRGKMERKQKKRKEKERYRRALLMVYCLMLQDVSR